MNKVNIFSSSPTNDEVKPQRKSLRWIKTFMLLLIILACAIYPMLKIRWAHNQIESFCMELTIGEPIHGLEEKAKERGLKLLKFKPNGTLPGKIIVWEGWAFARWNCAIEHISGKVVGKNTYFLD
jgi:hypothetical protein